jgi:hypothetical protein
MISLVLSQAEVVEALAMHLERKGIVDKPTFVVPWDSGNPAATQRVPAEYYVGFKKYGDKA